MSSIDNLYNENKELKKQLKNVDRKINAARVAELRAVKLLLLESESPGLGLRFRIVDVLENKINNRIKTILNDKNNKRG
ncbi:MAG: hypothetical protein GOVbin2014_21 [Prokaryotic dsDNA virus sp.]|nr:MAG: hypothetical protein GOVbin2014_21 [Prokaryotic dsDNA virus sp.]|tara:strand:+ start:10626 stop:10862 length:237 start_codon:yes stop_codon:yes gene_type:complete